MALVGWLGAGWRGMAFLTVGWLPAKAVVGGAGAHGSQVSPPAGWPEIVDITVPGANIVNGSINGRSPETQAFCGLSSHKSSSYSRRGNLDFAS